MEIIHGDCLDVMVGMSDNSIDAVICDPPYGTSWRGVDWDRGLPCMQFWNQMLRLAKPGAYLLAFGNEKTTHRLTCNIEDAGWELRHVLMWLYSKGAAKSVNISKAVEAQVLLGSSSSKAQADVVDLTGQGKPSKRKGMQWNKFTDSKQGVRRHEAGCWEPTTEEAKKYVGQGSALKPCYDPIVMFRKPLDGTLANNVMKWGTGGININGEQWPTNIIHDGCIPERFFYQLQDKEKYHPVSKPTALMQYLCRLVTPPGGTVLDPFCGSGSTGKAAVLEGFDFIGIEKKLEYVEISRRRLNGH